MTRWESDSNESMYKKWCMGACANGVKCVVVEWVKRNIRWFVHTERMKREEFVKKVYVSERVGCSQRGRPLGRWKDRVKEYLCERGDGRGSRLEQVRRECLDRERWRLFWCHQTLKGRPQRESGNTDRYTHTKNK